MDKDEIEFAINEQLGKLRLQLMIVDKMSSLKIELKNEDIKKNLKIDGHLYGKEIDKESREFTLENQQMISYFAIMDSVAGILYGDSVGNRARFEKLFKDFIIWEDANKVSIPHLYQLLRVFPFPEFENARKKVFDFIDGKLKESSTYYIGMDIPIGKVGTWFNGNVREALKPTGISLNDITHSTLLYKLRNKLVHSASSYGRFAGIISSALGGAIKINTPLYLAETYSRELESDPTPKTYDVKFELFYPLGFVALLAKKAINELQDHLLKFRVNEPIPSQFDTYFYDILNTKVP